MCLGIPDVGFGDAGVGKGSVLGFPQAVRHLLGMVDPCGTMTAWRRSFVVSAANTQGPSSHNKREQLHRKLRRRPCPGIHHDYSAQVLTVSYGIIKSDRASPVLDHEYEVFKIQSTDEVR